MERNDDHTAEAWFADLRLRFLDVARKRVPVEQLEDLVQDALRIVFEKGWSPGSTDVEGLPGLAWCFQVLRNTIGNFYQKRATRHAVHADDPSGVDRVALDEPTPLESLERQRAARLIEEALGLLATGDRSCAKYLARLLEGNTPADLAEREGVDRAILYRRVYRCRQKLRGLLEERGVQL